VSKGCRDGRGALRQRHGNRNVSEITTVTSLGRNVSIPRGPGSLLRSPVSSCLQPLHQRVEGGAFTSWHWRRGIQRSPEVEEIAVSRRGVPPPGFNPAVGFPTPAPPPAPSHRVDHSTGARLPTSSGQVQQSGWFQPGRHWSPLLAFGFRAPGVRPVVRLRETQGSTAGRTAGLNCRAATCRQGDLAGHGR